MIVLHACWSPPGSLLLWAEHAALPAPAPRPGRAPREPRPHPFAAGHELLAASVGHRGAAVRAPVVLPTASGVPVPSPHLVRDELPSAGPPRPRWWTVPALSFEPDEALAVLRDDAIGLVQVGVRAGEARGARGASGAGPGAVVGGAKSGVVVPAAKARRRAGGTATRGVESAFAEPEPPKSARQVDTVSVGVSVRVLAAMAAFAADLVGRGRVMPTLAGDQALWAPVLTGSDAQYARSLALALPPAVFAAAGDGVLDGSALADSGLADSGRADSALGDRAQGGPAPGERMSGAGMAAPPAAALLDTLVDAAARAALPSSTPVARTPADVSAWLAALTGRQRRLAVPPARLGGLAAALRSWQSAATAGAVRACFRLVEPRPEEPDDAWRVEFALQAVDEPSLVVDAERVWRSRSARSALRRYVTAPRKTLLAELGRATRLYPPLEPALRTAQPSTMDFDGTEAHRLLRDGAPLLAAAGFGVLLPGWWSRPGNAGGNGAPGDGAARLGARLTTRAATGAAPGTVAIDRRVGLDAIVDYQWELALGGEPLTGSELRRLTKLKTPLVRLRGQWVEIDPQRLAAGLQLLARPPRQSTVGELLELVADPDGGPGGVPVVDVIGDGPVAELLGGGAEHRIAPVAVPPRFRGELRQYQQRGLNWLSFLGRAGLGGVLADDMGLGKTVQLLALLAGDPAGTPPTLLVCPMSLVGNWQREAARFAPELRVHVHHGAERARGEAFATAVRDADLVLTTYALAARDAAALSTMDWYRVVLDEAQAIKNAATRQAVAIRSLPARHRIAVTGTPVENRLADLWSIMEFANPGLLGPAQRFKRRFAEPVERRGDEEAARRLRLVTQPFILRRLKTDPSIISDLPEKLEMDVLCNLTAEQASLYQAVVEDMLARIEASEGVTRRGLVLATMTKLKQVCNHPAQLLRDGSRLAGRSGKLARLEEILEEVLAAGEKALLFTQYAGFGGMLRAHLSARFGREVAFLHGGVRKAERDEMVARFNAETPSSPPLFVLSLKAGGTGLTLTAANHVVHVDRWWNPAVEDQATDRAYRIGQRRAVQVRKFVCAGTVEERISTMIAEKRGLAASIVGTGEQWLTELSTAALREMLTLDASAVVE